jgi:hypothetical protein
MSDELAGPKPLVNPARRVSSDQRVATPHMLLIINTYRSCEQTGAKREIEHPDAASDQPCFCGSIRTGSKLNPATLGFTVVRQMGSRVL